MTDRPEAAPPPADTSIRGPSAPGERPRSRSLKPLLPLAGYMRPYVLRMIGASVALMVSSATVLALGQGVRALVDQGFSTGNADLLDDAVGALIAVIALLAASTYARF